MLNLLQIGKWKLKKYLFRCYGWLALAATIILVALIFQYAASDKFSLISTVLATGLGFCYFVQQQKLSETALFKNLFTEFNDRYDDLNDALFEITKNDSMPTPEQRKIIVDYFNLCAEEYLFYQEGYIHEKVWRSWCRGMLFYMEKEPFLGIWNDEQMTESYYGLSIEVIRKGVGAKYT